MEKELEIETEEEMEGEHELEEEEEEEPELEDRSPIPSSKRSSSGLRRLGGGYRDEPRFMSFSVVVNSRKSLLVA